MKISSLYTEQHFLKLLMICCLLSISFNASARSHCKSGTEIFSCDIKNQNISVCRINKNKVLYKFSRKRSATIMITSRPFYSRASSHESLRINNRQYDYVINSTLVINYADKRRRKARVSWLDVYKNKRKLARIDCSNNPRINTKGLSLVTDNLSTYRDVRLGEETKKRTATKKKALSGKTRNKASYAIQIMSTASKSKAKRVSSTFKKEGYNTFIKHTPNAGWASYRVRIGEYKDKQSVLRAQKGMKKRYRRNTYVQNSTIVFNK